MSKRAGEYEVSIGPDGSYSVMFVTNLTCDCIKAGWAESMEKAEQVARDAIADHKVGRANELAYVRKSRRFTVA